MNSDGFPNTGSKVPQKFLRTLPTVAMDGKKAQLPIKKILPTLPSLLSHPGVPLIHRELSWLQFNERVLEQARPNSQNLPLERIKFLAISASNLDEFFMIRMASLNREIALARQDVKKSRHLKRIQGLILEKVANFNVRQEEILELLAVELAQYGIMIVLNPKENASVHELGKRLFETHVLPKLPPLETFVPQRLADLKNLQSALIFPDGLWIRVPRTLPPVLEAQGNDGKTYFFFLDTMLICYLSQIFHLHAEPGLVRYTRDADVTTDLIEEGTEPTPDMLRACLSGKDRGRGVRLQYSGNCSTELLSLCMDRLGLSPQQLFPAPHSLGLHGLWKVLDNEASRGKTALQYPKWKGFIPEPFLNPKTLFKSIRERDFLLHHPYDSFDAFVIWLKTACEDDQVESIELTIYRLGTLSPITPQLKKAALTKKVRILIELRARFDESNNLAIAEDLSRAGVKVKFGFGKLKMHAKIALVTRREGGQVRHYTHLSTGNYNAKTAKQYTDLAIVTSNREIGEDARNFFDTVSKGEIPQGFKQLLLAPTKLHRRLLNLIQGEIKAALAGKPARIVAKVNALVDEQVVASLYRASQYGVQVDLIVRGACSLIPEVPGLSENIRVISIVDRFLEHSRFYYFGSSRKLYFSSADWMPRNFFRRLEIAFPVLDKKLFRFIEKYLIPAYFEDTVKARELTAQGTWKKRIPTMGAAATRAQFEFIALAERGYQNSILETE